MNDQEKPIKRNNIGVIDYDRLAGIYDALYGVEQTGKYSLLRALRPLLGTVLDIGCGTALITEYLTFEYYVGVDVSAAMLRVAKDRVPNNTDLVRCDARLMPFRDECFDTTVSVTVLHEVPEAVGEVVRVTKGELIITVFRRFKCAIESILGNLRGLEIKVLDDYSIKDVIIICRARREA